VGALTADLPRRGEGRGGGRLRAKSQAVSACRTRNTFTPSCAQTKSLTHVGVIFGSGLDRYSSQYCTVTATGPTVTATGYLVRSRAVTALTQRPYPSPPVRSRAGAQTEPQRDRDPKVLEASCSQDPRGRHEAAAH